MAWSPDGKYIASASNSQVALVWDAMTGERIFTYYGHSDWVNAVFWSPDSKRIASASEDTTVQVWDSTTGDNYFVYHGHSTSVNAVAWSPNGKCLASGGGKLKANYKMEKDIDCAIRVWQAI